MPKLILTGFSSFCGVKKNPTEDIISAIRPNESRCSVVKNVLEVSVEGVKSFHSEIQINCTNSPDDVIIIHLGVDSGGTEFKVEKYAYNNMTFRVPDERGYQPEGMQICTEDDFDRGVCSSIHCEDLVERLLADGWTVKLSTDPGRFLCNYVYYQSLQQQSSKKALFVHVPPAEVIPIDKQVEFVEALLNKVLDMCDCKTEV